MCPQAGFPGSVEVVNVIHEERGNALKKSTKLIYVFLGQNESGQKYRKTSSILLKIGTYEKERPGRSLLASPSALLASLLVPASPVQLVRLSPSPGTHV